MSLASDHLKRVTALAFQLFTCSVTPIEDSTDGTKSRPVISRN